jgi:hypothetical protein
VKEQTAWQPIESAPKDGTKIDLWVHFAEDDRSYRQADAYWNADEGTWQLGQYHTGQFLYPVTPTHWMPLPDPPALATIQDPRS